MSQNSEGFQFYLVPVILIEHHMQSWAAVARGEILGPRCDSGLGLGLQRKASSCLVGGESERASQRR